jgi:hyperosmotically inducible protein
MMKLSFLQAASLATVLCACLVGLACRTNESPKAQVDDLQIATQIKAKLASDIGPSSVTDISVNSTNGIVTLSGQVDSADVKEKAVTIARAVPKVVRVVDSLQVTPKPQA